ncbi:hypothetical protein H6F90_19800 [Trichocoleus sp. FACHB-591]|uniref:hypothetical protein n=1 Tax=Trichocoleus TaxID=450526 RepID=UPI001682BF74|nr:MULTISPECIES: hypothetical protein [unclassified Trichocoleus]MBD2097347.1 hypothetical protein [Trichocoleus sp. FACHB-591]MBD2120393.1 hypothetical protein [Trichocoleus sp. FACHB-262]
MQDIPFTFFIVFGFVWVIMGIVAVVAVLKADGQEIRFGKQGLLVAIPILIPIVLTLLYQVFRSLSLGHHA